MKQNHFWLTPPEMYHALDREFHFDFDPCPYPRPEEFNGVAVPWGNMNYVNPPFRRSDGAFGAGPTAFVRKAIEEQKQGKSSIIVIPTMAFINMLLEAGAELRSMGRVSWLDCESGKPWPSPTSITAFVLRGLMPSNVTVGAVERR
jgi:hypothetical protein